LEIILDLPLGFPINNIISQGELNNIISTGKRKAKKKRTKRKRGGGKRGKREERGDEKERGRGISSWG